MANPNHPRPRDAITEAEFRARLRRTEAGCLEWTGARTSTGYGQVYVRAGKRVRAHRLAWEFARGAIPVGMSVLHRCDNPVCCDVEHLWLGTQLDNVRDMDAKGRCQRDPTAASAARWSQPP